MQYWPNPDNYGPELEFHSDNSWIHIHHLCVILTHRTYRYMAISHTHSPIQTLQLDSRDAIFLHIHYHTNLYVVILIDRTWFRTNSNIPTLTWSGSSKISSGVAKAGPLSSLQQAPHPCEQLQSSFLSLPKPALPRLRSLASEAFPFPRLGPQLAGIAMEQDMGEFCLRRGRASVIYSLRHFNKHLCDGLVIQHWILILLL